MNGRISHVLHLKQMNGACANRPINPKDYLKIPKISEFSLNIQSEDVDLSLVRKELEHVFLEINTFKDYLLEELQILQNMGKYKNESIINKQKEVILPSSSLYDEDSMCSLTILNNSTEKRKSKKKSPKNKKPIAKRSKIVEGHATDQLDIPNEFWNFVETYFGYINDMQIIAIINYIHCFGTFNPKDFCSAENEENSTTISSNADVNDFKSNLENKSSTFLDTDSRSFPLNSIYDIMLKKYEEHLIKQYPVYNPSLFCPDKLLNSANFESILKLCQTQSEDFGFPVKAKDVFKLSLLPSPTGKGQTNNTFPIKGLNSTSSATIKREWKESSHFVNNNTKKSSASHVKPNSNVNNLNQKGGLVGSLNEIDLEISRCKKRLAQITLTRAAAHMNCQQYPPSHLNKPLNSCPAATQHLSALRAVLFTHSSPPVNNTLADKKCLVSSTGDANFHTGKSTILNSSAFDFVIRDRLSQKALEEIKIIDNKLKDAFKRYRRIKIKFRDLPEEDIQTLVSLLNSRKSLCDSMNSSTTTITN